ncbi:MAG: DnaA N-terminal domain-containing protein [Solirubrobacteraceae bacterium]
MSREAIAAVLAREDLSCGERLVAFSLASFADRENRARPGTPAAAERAGLARSRFLEARDRLVGRGLVVVEDAASGRGRASTLALPFADTGPWWEGEINAELFEAVLGYSRAHGPGRLLVAAMGALADEHGLIEGLTTERLCAAAGISDRTYRRVHGPLLASGELVLRRMTRGRGNTNSWEIPDPGSGAAVAESRPRRRVAPPPGTRPLVAAVAPPTDERNANQGMELEADRASRPGGGEKGGQDRTLSPENRPGLSGVRGGKGSQSRTVAVQNRPGLSGNSGLNRCQDWTLSVENPAENPAETPAETPAPIARAGREPQNPRTIHPPNPPEGGSGAGQVLVEETYLTERGRRRRRLVAVDLTAVGERLRAAGEADLAAWEQVRAFLREAVGESTFEIWLALLELIAVDVESTLIVSTPAETVSWVTRRFGRVLDAAGGRAGRRLRVADEVERKAAESPAPAGAAAAGAARAGGSAAAQFGRRPGSADAADVQTGVSEVAMSDPSAAGRAEQSARGPAYRSDYPSSYTDVYNQSQEVS